MKNLRPLKSMSPTATSSIPSVALGGKAFKVGSMYVLKKPGALCRRIHWCAGSLLPSAATNNTSACSAFPIYNFNWKC